MRDVLHLDDAALRDALPFDVAIDALEVMFAGGLAQQPARGQHDVEGGDLLVMPATSPAGTGVKLVTVAPANPSRGLPLIAGLYVLFDGETLAPAALVDGAALTGIRTAAVSALATRYLARDDAARLVVLGAGTQARTHVEAMTAVRPISSVVIASRSAGRAEELVSDLRSAGIDAVVGEASAIAQADVICACTSSARPVLHGAQLPAGVHVNAVGSYRPERRELDTAAVQRGRIVVEDREAALEEAGDLCIPINDGDLSADDIVADLTELVTGAEVRRVADDITVFKSVGLASEDLALVITAVDRHRGGSS